MNFSWVPFYRELAGKVLEFEDRKDELLALDCHMRDEGLFTGKAPELKAIDPFTFFLRIGSVNSGNELQKSCAFLKTQWHVRSDIPTGFDGFAKIHSGALRFHYANKAAVATNFASVISNLWQLAKQAYQGMESVDESLFDRCLKNCSPDGPDIYRLATGLSWLNPEEFLPFSATYLEDEYEERLDERSPFRKYTDFLHETRRLNSEPYLKPFYQLVFEEQHSTFDFTNHVEVDNGIQISEQTFPTMQVSLNQILYGPPGTGKTFESVSKALALIDGAAASDRMECQRRFHELRAQGQIGFVTFHQSFSYEEFIEGLRPVITNNEGEVRYEIRDGFLKRIARSATQRLSAGNDWSFDFAWSLVRDFVSQNPNVVVDGRSAKSKFELSLGKDRITGRNIISPSDSNNFRCLEEIARKAWDSLKHKPDITSYDVQKCEPTVGAEGAIHAVILNKMRDLVSERNKAKKFVIIIDEINRGNVSKIFGELITLLEDDKRIGAPNELRVTLPTSGEEFALPPNLYILGTMNTADKSLAQLDVALRRRFEFEELPPRPELCKELPLLPEVLTALNERLEWAVDREHRLGHAYFMDVNSETMFNARFRSKVVPLLIEYFPHDFKTLRAVLGEKSDGFLHEFTAPVGFNGPTKYRWWFEVTGTDEFSAFEQLKTNLGVS